MKNKSLYFLIILLIFPIEITISHSGRTDSKDGHRNRKTDGNHYHNSGRVKTSYPKKKTNYKSSYRTVPKKKDSDPFEFSVISNTLLNNDVHKIEIQIKSYKNTTTSNEELKKIASNYWNKDSYDLNIYLKNEIDFSKPPWKLVKKRNGSLPDIFFN